MAGPGWAEQSGKSLPAETFTVNKRWGMGQVIAPTESSAGGAPGPLALGMVLVMRSQDCSGIQDPSGASALSQLLLNPMSAAGKHRKRSLLQEQG